jgi:rhodanese-related sulfurtransferase
MKQIAPSDLTAWLGDPARAQPVLLDVREPWEFQTCSIPGSRHIPMGQIPARAREVDPQQEVVVICHHGARSMQVAMFLERNGYAKVHNLAGGVDSWARTVDRSMPVY